MERDEIGRNLKAAREAAGITQAQAAGHVGVDQMTVSRWERGENVPSKAALKVLHHLYKNPHLLEASSSDSVPRGTYTDSVTPGVTNSVTPAEGADSPTSGGGNDFPRHLEAMVRRAEAVVYEADIEESTRTSLLFGLRNPVLIRFYQMGFEERQQTVQEQQQMMENTIAATHEILRKAIEDRQRRKRDG